jgi:ketosteroid isomerase-like protein
MAEEAGATDPVERLRLSNDACNRPDLDAWASLLSPDIVFRPVPSSPGARECRGRDEVRRFHEGFLEAWADDFIATHDTVCIYGDAVIARSALTGHARASGVGISGGSFEAVFFQDGLISRWEAFTDREEALKAAGVSG